MRTTCLTFYNNLREACRIYAEKSYKELKTISTHVKFSESFTAKMKKLIKMVELRQRKISSEKLRISVATVLGRVAVIFFVTVALALTVSVSVEAARNSILQYLTEIFDDHIRIRSVNMDPYSVEPVDNGVENSEDMLAVYVDRLVDMGFEVVKHEETIDGIKYYYFSRNDTEITVTRFSVEKYQITTMHYDKTSLFCKVKDINVYELEDHVGWYWIDEEFVYEIMSNVNNEEGIKLLNQIIG